MRIISGEFKGRHLVTKLPRGIRPTQDSMRETIFNVLANYFDLNELCVADVCAGAGMLGIEALSRGAEFTYFVDKNYKSIEYIKNSLQALGVSSARFSVNNLDALQFINHIANMQKKQTEAAPKIDLLFLDPPYNTTIANEVLLQIADLGVMRKKGMLVVETSIYNNLMLSSNLQLLSVRQFGASKVHFISA